MTVLYEVLGKQIPANEIEKGTLIGKGTFGEVVRAKWNGVDVAVKVNYLKSIAPHLKTEYDAVFLANGHPNILTTYGICDQPGKHMKVMELMSISLGDWIEQLNQQQLIISPFVRNEIGHKIACGLTYLHSKNIAHKHLKGNNVLLRFIPGKGVDVKLADAGLSKLKLETSGNGAANGDATVRWRAPESFTREFGRLNPEETLKAHKAADVYSLGKVVQQMERMQKPYEQLDERQVVAILSGKDQEKIFEITPENTLSTTRAIIQTSTDLVPAVRLSAQNVQQTFEKSSGFLKKQALVPVIFSERAFRDILPAIAKYFNLAYSTDAFKHLAANPAN